MVLNTKIRSISIDPNSGKYVVEAVSQKQQRQQRAPQQFDAIILGNIQNKQSLPYYYIFLSFIGLAAPIEFANINFTNISLPPSLKMRRYEHWYVFHRSLFLKLFSFFVLTSSFRYVTMVVASGLNRAYFGLNESAIVPDHILTTGNSTAPFVVINAIANTTTNFIVYKVLSILNVFTVSLTYLNLDIFQ